VAFITFLDEDVDKNVACNTLFISIIDYDNHYQIQ